jgi:hypothetical protein
VDLAELVRRCGALPLPRLVEALREDQAQRWRAGQRPRAEAYLEAFPALATSAEDALVLVWGEVLLRLELGETPDLPEYRDRFPQHTEALAVQFELQRHLAGRLESTGPAGTEPLAAPGPALPAVPGYEVLSELGRGGMGVVYQARQVQLGRLVALKMILAGGQAAEEDLARFRTEAEAIARLQHPHIVQIHEIGEYQGQPFFSLEFCPGDALDKKLAGTPLPPREAAELVQTLARAMQAAHQAHVIHRDLKPANVLLAADGTPKITDFGLAKKLDEIGQTQTGAAVGTPSYMAPEQAEGRKQVGPLVDVYALGAILYECLTGRPPFKGPTQYDTLKQVVADDPVPPSQLQSTTPIDLETICLKCLRKEPGRRYADCQELADDLRRWLEGKPIRARRLGVAERVVRWTRREPRLAASVSVAALALVSVAIVLGVSAKW